MSRKDKIEKQRKAAFANRRFSPDSYVQEVAPELPPALQVAIAAGELAEIDDPSQPTSESQEELKRQKAKSDEVAREFCFLDPEDYKDEEARRGRVLTPQQLIDLVELATGCKCWYSLASEAMVEKELNPRDVALAKLKIGDNPDNLRDMRRWRDAIAEVRQEEANLVPLRPYKLFAIQICRKAGEPEYCCWVPGCHLREYDIVKFDSHNVPEQQIRGWRTALIELIRKGFCSEERVTKVFGAATGPASKRYNMVLQGLRNRRELDDLSDAPEVAYCCALCGESAADCQCFNEPVPCLECHHKHAHFPFCSHYEAWYNSLGSPAVEETGAQSDHG